MSTKTKISAPAIVVEAPVKKGRVKNYYVDTKAFDSAKESLSKQPNQVQIMMNHFAKTFTKVESASQGRVMCQSAIDNAGLKTVIEPNVLFAYYRKTMEEFGLRLA